MDLITAVAILVQQTSELQNIATQLGQQAYMAKNIVDQENSIIEVNPQVHALTANMNISVQSIQSTVVIVQQAIDKVAELSNT